MEKLLHASRLVALFFAVSLSIPAVAVGLSKGASWLLDASRLPEASAMNDVPLGVRGEPSDLIWGAVREVEQEPRSR